MKAIITFIKERGFTLMICGLLTIVTGTIAYVIFNSNPLAFGRILPTAALVLAITGFVIYFTGRISLAMLRRRNPPGRHSDSDSDE